MSPRPGALPGESRIGEADPGSGRDEPLPADPGAARPPAPVRVPLPRDASALPPLEPSFGRALDRALASLDLDLTPGMRDAIEAHVRLLLAWSPFVNLTAIHGAEAIALEHVADSLAAVPPLLDRLAGRRRRPLGLLDLGSGAGYPGIPVAVAIPAGTAALVDSVARKTAFLEAAAAGAGAALRARDEEPVRMQVVNARGEELARRPGQRERWEVVTARAVAGLPWLLELALPLVRPGGTFVAWKRDAGDGAFAAELDAAAPLLEELGADPRPEVLEVSVEGLSDHRLVLVTKRRATPGRWPRRPPHHRRLLR